MKPEEVLKGIEDDKGNLELSINHDASNDVVIFGSFGGNGFDRQEFSFKKNEQNQFLEGLASIINKNK